MLSVIIPTYNEKDNIPVLIPRVFKVLAENDIQGEIIIVDDNSPDKTAEIAQNLKSKYNVKVIVRKNERGLSSAAIKGMEEASGEIICVMDADLSHPPETIPKMYGQIVKKKAELVIASRHVKGGGIENWTVRRKMVSKVASLIARPLTRVKDPMSGFFMLRKEVIEGVPLKPKGYKIGLEIIVKGNYNHLVEVPFVFKNREHGESKLGAKVIKNYLSHSLSLYFYKESAFYQFLKFCAVGGLGIIVDLGIFSIIYWGYFIEWGQSTGTMYAQTISFTCAVASNFVFNRLWTFQDKEKRKTRITWQFLLFFTVSVSAWVIRTMIIYFMINYESVWRFYSMPIASWFISVLSIERFTLLIAIIIVTIWNFMGSKYLVFTKKKCKIIHYDG